MRLRRRLVPVKDLILDFGSFDPDRVIADIGEIRKFNRQRYEMEQLTAIVYLDPDRHICAGYKDVTNEEFWIRGHLPGMPLMPGVVMCETAAQMCSFYAGKYRLLGEHVVGFGGLEEVRFRDVVVPGDRLLIVAQMLKLRPNAMIVCRFQGFVRRNLVVEGKIKGIPLPASLRQNNTE